MIDKLSLHNAYNTVRKMIPCSVYIHSMIIIFVINFEKWDTQTQALDIKLFDIIKKTFIIYPSMYCSKYRPYQAVEYKLTDRIFRITTV